MSKGTKPDTGVSVTFSWRLCDGIETSMMARKKSDETKKPVQVPRLARADPLFPDFLAKVEHSIVIAQVSKFEDQASAHSLAREDEDEKFLISKRDWFS